MNFETVPYNVKPLKFIGKLMRDSELKGQIFYSPDLSTSDSKEGFCCFLVLEGEVNRTNTLIILDWCYFIFCSRFRKPEPYKVKVS